jgi:small subunit ribosomal protein S16
MLRIRLSRGGKKDEPVYKIVVAEKTKPVKGKFIEKVGSYNPVLKVNTLNTDRIKYWISVGAQPSRTVHNLLVREGVLDAPKLKVAKQKKKEDSK